MKAPRNQSQKARKTITDKMIRLEHKIRATTATIDEASHAVEVLSDKWVLSDAAAWGQKAGIQLPSIRVCKVPGPERQKRANAVKVQIKRLQSVLRRTRNAQFDESVKALKLLGTYSHGRLLDNLNRNFNVVSKPIDTDGERFLFPTEVTTNTI